MTLKVSEQVYYIGTAQSQILNDAIDGVFFATEATDGMPTMNGPIVQNDPDCLGIIAVVAMQDALKGTYPEMPGVTLDKMRLIMVGHATTLQFVTLKETGITSLDQLKGKRIATANPGTVVWLGSLQVLNTMGYEENDFASITAMTPGDMSDALKDGAIIHIGIAPNPHRHTQYCAVFCQIRIDFTSNYISTVPRMLLHDLVQHI